MSGVNILKENNKSKEETMSKGRPKKNKVDISENPGNKDLETEIPSVAQEVTMTKEQKEKKQRLLKLMNEINREHKSTILKFAKDEPDKERLSFGYKILDKLTGGGICRGNFSTIWGSKGTGKTTIAYKMIATAQKDNLICAYIDMEKAYDRVWAQKFGVDIDKLLYFSCNTAENTLDIFIKLTKEKVVDLIILDSIQSLSPHGEQFEGKGEKEKSLVSDTMALLARKLSQFFRISIPYVFHAKCAVLLIGQARMDLGSFVKMETLSGGHALLHNSRLILRLRRGQKTDAPFEMLEIDEEDEKGNKIKVRKQVGFNLNISVEKSQLKNCLENTDINIPFYYRNGIYE
jgi:protein RecA